MVGFNFNHILLLLEQPDVSVVEKPDDITTATAAETENSSPELLKSKLVQSFQEIQSLSDKMLEKGFISLTDTKELFNSEDEKINDWANDLSDLQLNISLDGDSTLNAQILLKEQGYRLTPDFGKFAFNSILRGNLGKYKQEITSEDYYMDTDYNSDPDKFEVKEVLLNIVIESSS